MIETHKCDDGLPDIGRLVIISDGSGAVFASLESLRDGLPVWHYRPFAYVSVIPDSWQYYNVVTGEVS